MFQRKLGLTLVLLGLAAIALLTLIPDPEQEELVRATPLACLVCGELGGVDVTLNLLLFLPFGVGLGLLGLPWPGVAALALATSGVVELLQMKVVPGRDASLGDLVTNSAGALFGAALARRAGTLLLPTPRAAARLATAWGLLWLAAAALTGASLHPAPTGSDWHGQWAPDLGHLDRFRGEVLEAWAGGEPLRPGRWRDTPAWRARLTLDTFALAATARAGPPTDRLAPIVSVFDDDRHEVALLGQWGTDLVYRIRMDPARLRLRNPAVRLPGALAFPPGDTVALLGGLRGPAYILAARGASRTTESVLPFSPHWTWALLLPYDYALGPEAGLLTALWLFGLLFPLGWWAAMAGPRARVGAALLVLAGVAGSRVLLGFAGAPTGEWIGAAGGVLAGGLLARAALGLNKPAFRR